MRLQEAGNKAPETSIAFDRETKGNTGRKDFSSQPRVLGDQTAQAKEGMLAQTWPAQKSSHRGSHAPKSNRNLGLGEKGGLCDGSHGFWEKTPKAGCVEERIFPGAVDLNLLSQRKCQRSKTTHRRKEGLFSKVNEKMQAQLYKECLSLHRKESKKKEKKKMKNLGPKFEEMLPWRHSDDTGTRPGVKAELSYLFNHLAEFLLKSRRKALVMKK